MPIHDWTRVLPGVFHDFHHSWIAEIRRALNRGILPPGYYAMAEQIVGGLGPDVLALERPSADSPVAEKSSGGLALATLPRVEFHQKTEADLYASKANAVTIRHSSEHRVLAVIEIVSPGNKNSRSAIRSFVQKAVELLHAGVHLLLIDLFPPGARDPQGIHPLIWEEFSDEPFTLPEERRLTQVAYYAGQPKEAFVQPMAVRGTLAEMPLFLERDLCVYVPLETIYQTAWIDVPPVWQDALATTAP